MVLFNAFMMRLGTRVTEQVFTTGARVCERRNGAKRDAFVLETYNVNAHFRQGKHESEAGCRLNGCMRPSIRKKRKLHC
jgi:hypothetical protein